MRRATVPIFFFWGGGGGGGGEGGGDGKFNLSYMAALIRLPFENSWICPCLVSSCRPCSSRRPTPITEDRIEWPRGLQSCSRLYYKSCPFYFAVIKDKPSDMPPETDIAFPQ